MSNASDNENAMGRTNVSSWSTLVHLCLLCVLVGGCAHNYLAYLPEDQNPLPQSRFNVKIIEGWGYWDLREIPGSIKVHRAHTRMRRKYAPKVNSVATVVGTPVYVERGFKILETHTSGGAIFRHIMGKFAGIDSDPRGGDTIYKVEVTEEKEELYKSTAYVNMPLHSDVQAVVEQHFSVDTSRSELWNFLSGQDGGALYLYLLEKINPPLRYQYIPGVWDKFEVTEAVQKAVDSDKQLLVLMQVVGDGIGWYWLTTENPHHRPQLVIEYSELDASTSVEPGRNKTTLSVNSTPEGADVFVDGGFVGTTPLDGTSVPTGSRSVQIMLPGYEPWQRTIDAGNDPITVNAKLRKQ